MTSRMAVRTLSWLVIVQLCAFGAASAQAPERAPVGLEAHAWHPMQSERVFSYVDSQVRSDVAQKILELLQPGSGA